MNKNLHNIFGGIKMEKGVPMELPNKGRCLI
jgi:hypothetical protein